MSTYKQNKNNYRKLLTVLWIAACVWEHVKKKIESRTASIQIWHHPVYCCENKDQ